MWIRSWTLLPAMMLALAASPAAAQEQDPRPAERDASELIERMDRVERALEAQRWHDWRLDQPPRHEQRLDPRYDRRPFGQPLPRIDRRFDGWRDHRLHPRRYEPPGIHRFRPPAHAPDWDPLFAPRLQHPWHNPAGHLWLDGDDRPQTWLFDQPDGSVAWVMVDLTYQQRHQAMVLRLRISNRGDQPLTLAEEDVELVTAEMQPLTLRQMQPAAPVEVPPRQALIVAAAVDLPEQRVDLRTLTLALTLRLDEQPITRTGQLDAPRTLLRPWW